MKKKIEATYIDLKQKRDICFPFMLSTAGVIKTSDFEQYNLSGYSNLEFCLRLKSCEKEAVDEINGKIYRSRFPHLLIKRPKAQHCYTINSSRDAIFLIYPPELEVKFAECGMPLETTNFEFNLNPELRKFVNEFQELIPKSQNRGVAEKFDIISYQILQNIFMQKILPTENQDYTANIIREIASYLQLNFMSVIDINDVCRKFGISRRSFFRNWSKHYDSSPLQYILNLKMLEAERLLLMQNIQIKEIAGILGFDNLSYFIQVFRRNHNDITPGQFRRNNIKGL